MAMTRRCFLIVALISVSFFSVSCNKEKSAGFQTDKPQKPQQAEAAANDENPNGTVPDVTPSQDEIPPPEPDQDYQRVLEKQKAQEEEQQARRETARQKALGRTMDRLETIDGKAYEDVTIREISAVGVSIRHDSGSARIPFERLPVAMQKEFHFDEEEKQQALTQERKIHDRHESAFTENLESRQLQTAQKQQNVDADKRNKLLKTIAMCDARISSLQSEISSLENDLSRDLEQASYHRLNRLRGGISRAPSIRNSISEKRHQLSILQQRVAAMRVEDNSMSR